MGKELIWDLVWVLQFFTEVKKILSWGEIGEGDIGYLRRGKVLSNCLESMRINTLGKYSKIAKQH